MTIKSYQDKVRALGCILCNQFDQPGSDVHLHHVESIRDGLSEYAVIPLCPLHHQGPNGVHGLSRRGFVSRYKLTDIDLMALVAKGLSES